MPHRPRQPDFTDTQGIRWSDPRLNLFDGLAMAKGVVIGSAVLNNLQYTQSKVWQAFNDGILSKPVLEIALPLFSPKPAGRVEGTRVFFQTTATAWGPHDPDWMREFDRVTHMHVDSGVVDPGTGAVHEELREPFAWIAGSMAYRQQKIFPALLKSAARRHWFNVAGHLGLTHAPATEEDFQHFIESYRAHIRIERNLAANRDELHRRAMEITRRIYPKIESLSGTTPQAFAAEFESEEDREWLGLDEEGLKVLIQHRDAVRVA